MNEDTVKLGLVLFVAVTVGALAGLLLVFLIKSDRIRPNLNPGESSFVHRIGYCLLWSLGVTLVLFVCSLALTMLLSMVGYAKRDVIDSLYMWWLFWSGVNFMLALVTTLISREVWALRLEAIPKLQKMAFIFSFVFVFSAASIISASTIGAYMQAANFSDVPLQIYEKISESVLFPYYFFEATLRNPIFPFLYVRDIVVDSQGNQFVIADRLPDHMALIGVVTLAGWGLGALKGLLSNNG